MGIYVSVVIPAYGCAGSIGCVLEGLFSQTVPVGEIIVVDDCSPDNLSEVLEGYAGRIRVIKNPRNLGLSASYNVGLRASVGKYLMTLHSDCVLEPTYVERLLILLGRENKAGAVMGSYLFEDFSTMGFPDKVFSMINLLPISEVRSFGVFPVSFIEGKADIFRREAIEPLGFFDERLSLTAEDQDLSVKLRMNGWVLLQDCSCCFRVVYSSTQDSLGKVLRKQRTYARGQGYILWKYRGMAVKSSTGNRNHRMLHRASQLVTVSLSIGLLLLSLVFPMVLWVLGFLLLLRYLYYVVLARSLRMLEALFVGFLGLQGDYYYTAGIFEGLFKTVTGQTKI